MIEWMESTSIRTLQEFLSENAALNAIDDIHFRACGIDQFEKTDCYDVVVANIQTDVLQNLSEEILTRY